MLLRKVYCHPASNWTTVELKWYTLINFKNEGVTSNWTTVELKYMARGFRLYAGSF